MSAAGNRSLLLALAAALLLLAAAARFHRLGVQSLWYDEGVAYTHSLRSLPELIPHLQRNVHLPAYFALLGWWQAGTGSSEFALRALSALLSVLSVAWACALGRRLFHPLAGLAAAALVALNSFSVYYAQEARMYAMLAAIAGGSMWLCAGLLRGWPRRRWAGLMALGLVNALGLYTHVAYGSVILAQLLLAPAAIAIRGRLTESSWRNPAASGGAARLLAHFGLANLLTFLLFAPWLPVSLRQVVAQPNLSAPAALDEILRIVYGHLALGVAYEQAAGNLGFALVLLLLFGMLPAPGRRRAWLLLPLVWLLASVAVYLYIGLTTRYLRFLLPAQMAFALWLGRGCWLLWAFPLRGRPAFLRAALKLAAAIALGALLLSLFDGLRALYYAPRFQRDDARGLAARIQDRLGEADAVLVSAAGLQEVFNYYYRGAAPLYALPTTKDAAATRSQMLTIIDAHERLQVVLYGAAEQDPALTVETTLNEEAYQISEEWVGDLRYLQYASPMPMGERIAVDARFGEGILLYYYALSGAELTAGDLLLTELLWIAQAGQSRRYKVFLQLLDADGALAAQRDSEPAGGFARTTNWAAGDWVIDRHALLIPADLPAGEYKLIAGLYDIDDPAARLPVGESSYIELGAITLN